MKNPRLSRGIIISLLTSQPHQHGETAAKETDVRVMSIWWSIRSQGRTLRVLHNGILGAFLNLVKQNIVNRNWTIDAIQNQRKPIVIQGNRPKKDIDQATSIVFIVAAAPFQCIQKRLNLRSCKSNLLARLYGKLPFPVENLLYFLSPTPACMPFF